MPTLPTLPDGLTQMERQRFTAMIDRRPKDFNRMDSQIEASSKALHGIQ